MYIHYLSSSYLRECVIFVKHVRNNYTCSVRYILSVIFTEFRSNGNWECSVPVHPGLFLHKLQPDYGHAGKHHLHSTGKFIVF